MAADNPLIREAEEKMKKSLAFAQQELAGLRTGRASPGLVENLKIDYYGTMTPLKQLAAIGVADAKTLEIRPWDKNAMAPVEKAIGASDLRLTPQRQGDIIRLVIPPLTEERRQELVKVCKKMGEDSRIAIRNVRQETNAKLKTSKDKKDISEDDLRKLSAHVQKLTDQYCAKIDEALANKAQEIKKI